MVDASNILKQDVLNWFEDSVTLNGTEITYKRFEEESYDPDSDNSAEYDTNTFDAVTMPIRSHEAAQDSRLQLDDKRLVFKQSDFPDDSDKSSDKPTAKDKVKIDDDTWTLDLDEEAIYETDDTETLYFIYIRRS